MASAVPFRKSLPPDDRDRAPQNAEAETIVLATIFADNNALREVSEIIKVEDFFSPNGSGLSWNGRVFLAMVALSLENIPLDTVTVIDHLKADSIFAGYIQGIHQTGNTWRGVNVGHYARAIRETSIQRKFLHKAHNLYERILAGELKSTEIATDLELFVRETAVTNAKDKLVAIDFCDLLTMNLPPMEYVIEPVVPYRSTTMTYAWRGVGKTYFTMEQAVCVATGMDRVFGWPIPKQRKVVYVDGELDSTTLQDRAIEIARGHGMQLPERGHLKLIGIDFQEKIRPKINTAEGRLQIEDHLEEGVWLILDNWSTLCPTGDQKEMDACAETQDWFLDLRKRRVTTSFLQHAGKGGDQRGYSGKEDILATVTKLREPDDYKRQQGLRAEVTLTKLRGKAKPELVQPFEISLGASSTGCLQWSMQPLTHLQIRRAFQMFAVDMKPHDVAQELGLKNRYVAYRWKKKFQENPDAGAWDPE